MRLSEAIRLGSLAIQEPRAARTDRCAVGMGLVAIGKLSTGDGLSMFSEEMKLVNDKNYAAIVEAWPWLRRNASNNYLGTLWYTFDSDVCEGRMTLEALCDQVRAWEDELEAKGINVEQVTMVATPEATHEPAAEKSEMVGVTEARDHESV